MSQTFGTVTVLPYQGTTFRLPVKLPQGVVVPPNQVPPSVCPVNIIWNNYWQLAGQPSQIGVAINLQAASVQASILDRIASVKIDNTHSSCPVYVWFPDTNDVVTCPPNTAVTMPCLTNLLNAVIIAEGLTAGNIPTTTVFFYNVVLQPSVDAEINNAVALWLASPTISRGTTILNTLYGTPALGDQMVNKTFTLTNEATSQVLPVQPSGFYYLTSIYIRIVEVWDNSVPAVGSIRLTPNSGINDVIFTFFFIPTLAQFTAAPADTIAYNQSGLNIKLDATQGMVFVNNLSAASGTCTITISYTYQP